MAHESIATDVVLCSQLDVLLLQVRDQARSSREHFSKTLAPYAPAALGEYAQLLRNYYQQAQSRGGAFTHVYGPRMDSSLSMARVYI